MKNIALLFLLPLFYLSETKASNNSPIDGSAFYGLEEGSVQCEKIPCIALYKEFIGTWEGSFQSFDQQTKKMRPYQNEVVYESFCYRNLENNDVFIVGQQKDSYPAFEGQAAKVVESLLIIGLKAGKEEQPFLRTVDSEHGLTEYEKVFTEASSEMSIWRYTLPAINGQPQMVFTLTDFRDLLAQETNKRVVYMSLIVGPSDRPYWQGIITQGFHTKQA